MTEIQPRKTLSLKMVTAEVTAKIEAARPKPPAPVKPAPRPRKDEARRNQSDMSKIKEAQKKRRDQQQAEQNRWQGSFGDVLGPALKKAEEEHGS